jgi:hypothetical protein
MSWTALLSKTTMANVTASLILIGALLYAVLNKDIELLKSLALFSAGWLFGVTATRTSGEGRAQTS